MKLHKLVLALGALFSSAALACPDLSGDYTCAYQDHSEILSLTQEVRDGVTYFKMGQEELAADNQVRPLPDDESMKDGTLRGWCEGEALNIEILGKVQHAGEFFGDLAAQVSFSLNEEKNLKQVTSGSLKTVDANYPLDETTTCTRNP